jgi:hypothetical protein
MQTSTTLQNIFSGNIIHIPDYQRAYSWDTSSETEKKEVNIFIEDLYNHYESKSNKSYYFGHFLFKKTNNNNFYVIDGQQRLTTIVIFVSALFEELKKRNIQLSQYYSRYYFNMIKCDDTYIFNTVEYDNQFFKDYVIDRKKINSDNLKTLSSKRIAKAFNYFTNYLQNQNLDYLENILDIILNAKCSAYLVNDESEAIQMFIFQNNRGKKPTNLEIIKAQFMHSLELSPNNDKNILLDELKNRFKLMYESISLIEDFIDEDMVLTHALRLYFNSLFEDNSLKKINDELNNDNSLFFIVEFSRILSESFSYLTLFYGNDQKECFEIHSLQMLKNINIIIPFILKFYIFNISKDKLKIFCKQAESLVLRHRLIGTRANLISRLNDVFSNFSKDNSNIQPIIERIESIKSGEGNWWWQHWNKGKLAESITGYIDPTIAKFILWKYENFLESEGKNGYINSRYDTIESPQLEHIAPTTVPIKHSGYADYDSIFMQVYIERLGNYLLISKSHNCSIGNIDFNEKLQSYKKLYQQRELKNFLDENTIIWNKSAINKRHKKICNFILSNF